MCADSGGKHTETVGTVTHQPPELLREGLLTPAADVWAFGVLLWSVSGFACVLWVSCSAVHVHVHVHAA